jgi:alpha-1,3/alpha-1,6-mannosyltransferase
VVDAALALQKSGHQVDIFTSHHDPAHCFEETRDGTLRVFVYGDHLPRSVFNAGAIMCAIARSLWAASTIMTEWRTTTSPSRDAKKPLGNYDVFIVDQLSVSMPLLCAAPPTTRIFFYCHFPDQLLTQRTSLLKRLYRLPFDALEELTTGVADAIVVNSRFTASVYKRTFTRLAARGPAASDPGVLYPSINFERYDDNVAYDEALGRLLDTFVTSASGAGSAAMTAPLDRVFLTQLEQTPAPLPVADANVSVLDTRLEAALPLSAFVFLSINRYERKKDIPIAIRAFAQAARSGGLPDAAAPSAPVAPVAGAAPHRVFTSARLVIAGGFDPRVAENVEHHQELRALATELGLTCADYPYAGIAGIDTGGAAASAAAAGDDWDTAAQVIFVRSFTEAQRRSLLRRAQAVVYTPTGEHFGIVPVEAMFARRPVIACASGGPLESINTAAGAATGVLCAPGDAGAFAEAFARLSLRPAEAAEMGERGPAHVRRLFSFETFQKDLDSRVRALAADGALGLSGRETGSSAPAVRRCCARLGSSPRARIAVLFASIAAALVIVLFAVVCSASYAASRLLR